MDNSYIIITGASGWLGKTAVEMMYNILPHNECKKRLALFSSKKKNYLIRGKKQDIAASSYALQDLPLFAKSNSIYSIIHTAFLTKDRIPSYGLESFIRENKEITDLVCEALSYAQNARVVGISSGAALAAEEYSENISQAKPDSYAVLKYEEEKRLRIYTQPLILRIFALSGRHMRDPSQFALGDFLISAIRHEQINVKAKMPVIRGYGYADDICMLAIKWLMTEQSAPNESIDTVSHTLSLVELANLISSQYNLPDPLSHVDQGKDANFYTANSHPYVSLLRSMKLNPTSMSDQIHDTYSGLKSDFSATSGNP